MFVAGSPVVLIQKERTCCNIQNKTTGRWRSNTYNSDSRTRWGRGVPYLLAKWGHWLRSYRKRRTYHACMIATHKKFYDVFYAGAIIDLKRKTSCRRIAQLGRSGRCSCYYHHTAENKYHQELQGSQPNEGGLSNRHNDTPKKCNKIERYVVRKTQLMIRVQAAGLNV